jgi:hypothetical protein
VHAYLSDGPFNGIVATMIVDKGRLLQPNLPFRITTRDAISAAADRAENPDQLEVMMYSVNDWEPIEGLPGHVKAGLNYKGKLVSARELIDHVLDFDPRRIG